MEDNMPYESFQVRFGALHGDRVHVTVDSSAGSADGWFRLPNCEKSSGIDPGADSGATPEPGRDLLRRSKKISSLRDPARGDQLFRALFRDELRGLFDRAVGASEERSAVLRLVLVFDPNRHEHRPLIAEPWEELYWHGRREFLDLSITISVVRRLAIPRRRKTLEVDLPLRILLVAANPTDTQALDWWRDLREIRASLAPQRHIAIEVITRATREALGRRLREGEFHILHFIGHGGLDETAGQGGLHLESPEGEADPINASTLAVLCGACAELRLVCSAHVTQIASQACQNTMHSPASPPDW